MEVGEVPKGIRWSAEAGGPPKVRIGGVNGRGRCPTEEKLYACGTAAAVWSSSNNSKLWCGAAAAAAVWCGATAV